MGHDALNKSISIPDLPRNPNIWNLPNADMLYNDHLIDPLVDETLREDWLGDETNSNPLGSGEKDEEESRYGSKLGSLAVGFNEGEESGEDEESDLDETGDEEKE